MTGPQSSPAGLIVAMKDYKLSRRDALKGAGVVGLSFGLASLLSACGIDPETGGGAATGTAGGTLTLGIDATNAVFDPAFFTSLGDWMVVDSVCRGLTKIDFDSPEAKPDLADWTVSEDGMEYVFTLRDGIMMHDGNLMTTADVERSLKRQWDPDDPTLPTGASRQLAATGLNVAKMEALDEKVIKFTLINPDLTFPARMSDVGGRILSAAAIEELGADIGKAPVGSGPFKFSSATAGQQVVLEAFEDFIDGKPFVDRLVFQQVQDQATIVSSLNSGELSATQFTPFSSLDQIRSSSTITLQESTFGADAIMMMDVRRPALAELEVRQAINLAIDRDALIARAFYGAAVQPEGYLIPPPQPSFDASLADLTKRDVERAKSLIEEAGAAGRTVRILAASDSWHPTAMQIIEQNLIEIGLKVETQTVEPSAYFSRLMDAEDPYHDLMIWERNSYVPDPDNMVGAVAGPDSIYGTAVAGWGTLDEYQEMAEFMREQTSLARQTPNGPERTELYTAMQRRFADEVAAVAPLVAFTNPVASQNNVKGMNVNALAAHRCYMDKASIG